MDSEFESSYDSSMRCFNAFQILTTFNPNISCCQKKGEDLKASEEAMWLEEWGNMQGGKLSKVIWDLAKVNLPRTPQIVYFHHFARSHFCCCGRERYIQSRSCRCRGEYVCLLKKVDNKEDFHMIHQKSHEVKNFLVQHFFIHSFNTFYALTSSELNRCGIILQRFYINMW